VNRPAAGVLPATFWAAARVARTRLLALDFDGTLAPFVVDPAAARPLPAARRALDRIVANGGTELAILTGRPAAEAAALLAPLALPIAGEHGWERRLADGTAHVHPVTSAQSTALAAAERVVAALAPARGERKRTALVIHTRGLEPATAEAIHAAARRELAAWTVDGSFSLRPIDGGLELRLTGRDKGTALGELVASSGEGTFVVAVGDDETDEDAFRVARRLGGWAIGVGRRPDSVAQASLTGPDAVAAFLAEWAERLGTTALAGAAGGERRAG